MQIEKLKVSSLIPYENNAKLHPQEQINQIVASIKECGFNDPIAVDENNVIIEGHGRWMALKQMGVDEVECIRLTHLTEEQKKAYILIHNKLTMNTDFDISLLEMELQEIETIDMTEFGFDLDFDLDDDDYSVEEDDYEAEPPAEPKTKLGDIWQLGRHRLMCGDSTDKASIKKLLGDNEAGLLLTDPPYGINADKGVGGFGNTKGNKYEDDWDGFSPSKNFFDMILKIPAKAIIFGGNYFTDKLPLGKHWIVWDKVGGIDFKNPYSDCELAWSNISKESVKKYTVIQQGFVAEEKEKRVHPTQKSVKLFCNILTDYAEENEIVLDVFGGSGTTLIACEQLDRTCFMMELDPKYCDVIIDRWEQLTGEKAVLVNA